jgi:hypothetical protein
MPTQPRSHSREDSLSVPDTSDPLTFTGSVVGSISRRNRRSFAAIAQKTSSAFASFSTQTSLRSSNSNVSLSRSRFSGATPWTPPFDENYVQLTETSRPCSPALVDALSNPPQKRPLTLQRLPTPPHENRTSPPGGPPKMHQTSSRLLRMTEDERPFTKVRSRYGIRREMVFPTNNWADLRRISWTCSPL